MRGSLFSLRGLAGGILILGVGACAPAVGESGGSRSMPGRPSLASIAHLSAASPLRSTTLESSDMWLRHYVVEGRQDSLSTALEANSRLAPKDILQRNLQIALALHQAGKYAESNALFEDAETEAELRYSKSVSQFGLSLVTNDGAMDFTPTRAEMAMIPYYRMQNYLHLGQIDGAVVEARKASAYMQVIDQSTGDACRSSTFLKYLTGLVYELGGESGDAAVSLRQAEAGYDQCADTYGFGPPPAFGTDLVRVSTAAGLSDVATAAATRYGVAAPAAGATDGDVVVLVENGFVAHKTNQSLNFPIYDGDVAEFDPADPLAMLTTSVVLADRVITNLSEQNFWGAAFDDLPEVQLGQALDGAYIMEMAWPAFRLEANRAPRIRVAAGELYADAAVAQDISAEVVRDFEATRKLVLARAVARGITKYVAAQKLENEAESRGGMFAGFVAGALGNLAANALERADTRSWSLLPDQLVIARLRLPAGQHEVNVQITDSNGAVIGTKSVGTVTVEPGKLALVNSRVWGSETGDRTRLAQAISGVAYAEASGEPGTDVAPAPSTYVTSPPRGGTTPPTVPAATASSSGGVSTPVAAPVLAPAQQEAAVTVSAEEADELARYNRTRHRFALTEFSVLGVSAEYMRSQYGRSLGIGGSYMYHETEDDYLDIYGLDARTKLHFSSNAPGGLGMTASVGGALIDDAYAYEYGSIQAITVGMGLEYTILLGPLAVGIGGGYTGAFGVGGETAVEGYDWSNGGRRGAIDRPMLFAIPRGGVSLGLVF